MYRLVLRVYDQVIEAKFPFFNQLAQILLQIAATEFVTEIIEVFIFIVDSLWL